MKEFSLEHGYAEEEVLETIADMTLDEMRNVVGTKYAHPDTEPIFEEVQAHQKIVKEIGERKLIEEELMRSKLETGP